MEGLATPSHDNHHRTPFSLAHTHHTREPHFFYSGTLSIYGLAGLRAPLVARASRTTTLRLLYAPRSSRLVAPPPPRRAPTASARPRRLVAPPPPPCPGRRMEESRSCFLLARATQRRPQPCQTVYRCRKMWLARVVVCVPERRGAMMIVMGRRCQPFRLSPTPHCCQAKLPLVA